MSQCGNIVFQGVKDTLAERIRRSKLTGAVLGASHIMGVKPVTCLQSAVTNASESRLYPSSHAHASCPEASGVLANNSRGKGHVMKRRWHVEALGSSGDKVSTPGVEPGLSRPRRDVLTTRRCGPCVSCIFCVLFVLLCQML